MVIFGIAVALSVVKILLFFFDLPPYFRGLATHIRCYFPHIYSQQSRRVFLTFALSDRK
jgi:hypothetical protein